MSWLIYGAPELLNGEGTISSSSRSADIYALAMVVFELMTLTKPFSDHQSPSPALVSRIVSNGLRPTVPADISPPLKTLLQSMWSAEPSKRPSAAHVHTAIAALQQ